MNATAPVDDVAPGDAVAIRAILAQLQHCWGSLNFSGIRRLWDQGRSPIYLAEEAEEPHTSWAELDAYWQSTTESIERLQMRIEALQLRALSPDLISAVYKMHWDGVVRGMPRPVGGDNRVVATLRRTAGGWRFAQYVEAPLAAIVYLRKLYERAADQGFR